MGELSAEQRQTMQQSADREYGRLVREIGHSLDEEIDELKATIARLEGERDHLATMTLPTPATGESAIEFAQRVLREHAEMRGKDWDKLDDELCVACMWSQLILAADASARADAARMRAVLEKVAEDDDAFADGCVYAPEAKEALSPDDGWLARKLEEAVKPYKEMLLLAGVYEVTDE